MLTFWFTDVTVLYAGLDEIYDEVVIAVDSHLCDRSSIPSELLMASGMAFISCSGTPAKCQHGHTPAILQGAHDTESCPYHPVVYNSFIIGMCLKSVPDSCAAVLFNLLKLSVT